MKNPAEKPQKIDEDPVKSMTPRMKAAAVASTTAVLALVSLVGPPIVRGLKKGDHQQEVAALLTQPRSNVLAAIWTGQLNPHEVTQVTTIQTSYAYNEAAKIRGFDAVDPNDPLIGEIIAQTPEADPETNTVIPAGTELIIARKDVQGNQPDILEEINSHQNTSF
ncbi:MAG TPA: hypothetical protein VLF79_00445 [Candidatus Saccharimonadales bacterium]|nr:hypothetical protein [Candidatus Saccharimonadales bacterium]